MPTARSCPKTAPGTGGGECTTLQSQLYLSVTSLSCWAFRTTLFLEKGQGWELGREESVVEMGRREAQDAPLPGDSEGAWLKSSHKAGCVWPSSFCESATRSNSSTLVCCGFFKLCNIMRKLFSKACRPGL